MICSLYRSLTQSAPRLQVETEDYLMTLFGILPIDCYLQVFYSKLVNYGSPRLGSAISSERNPVGEDAWRGWASQAWCWCFRPVPCRTVVCRLHPANHYYYIGSFTTLLLPSTKLIKATPAAINTLRVASTSSAFRLCATSGDKNQVP
jgi:hypothetical protein